MAESFEYETLSARLENVRQRIAQAAERANRSPKEITLIAISKTHPAGKVRLGLDAGIIDLGENRVQEAEQKIAELGRQAARWHLVGHLQTNKARKAVHLFDFIHSVDSADLLRRLERHCVEEDRKELPVLVQIDLAGEKTKTGVDSQKLDELLETARMAERVQLRGLMTLPPYFENPDCARPFFKALTDLRDELESTGVFGGRRGELSMGMSHDFEIAIEEGATMVRVGTAIFGERV